jgi:hypothetical protein
MTKILQFPGKELQAWRQIEKAVRDILAEAGLTDAAASTICAEVKLRYETIQGNYNLKFEFDVPAECRVLVDQIAAQMGQVVHECTNRALLQIVDLATQLHLARTPR